jgi:signal transduction histidine kinase
MGGEISVESTVGRGTCFRVKLPISKQALVAQEPVPEEAS